MEPGRKSPSMLIWSKIWERSASKVGKESARVASGLSECILSITNRRPKRNEANRPVQVAHPYLILFRATLRRRETAFLQ